MSGNKNLIGVWSYRFMIMVALFLCAAPAYSQCSFTFTYVNNGNGNFTFSNTTSPTNTTSSISWTFTGGTPSLSTSNTTVNVTYPSNGAYTVMASYSTAVPTCTQPLSTITISVTGICSLSAGFTTSLGPNGLAVFTSTGSGITNYSWQANTSGTNSVLATTYTANGVYPVSLVVSNGSCQDSLTDSVTISNICSIDANATYSTGPNGQVQLINNSTGNPGPTSYTWNFGGGNNSTQVSPSYTYYVNGTHPVTLTAVNDSIPNCSDTFTMLVVVSNIICNAGFTYSVLPNGVVSFSSTSQPATSTSVYSWTMGGITFSTMGTPTALTSYSANGSYPVTLNFNSGNCYQTITQTIVVNSIIPCLLFADFTYTQGPNGLVTFTNTSGGITGPTSYTWNLGDNSFSQVFSPIHTYSANGFYVVTLFASMDSINCADDTTLTIFVNSYTCNLVASFSHTVGSNGNVTYSSTSSPTQSSQTYSWNFGDGYWAAGALVNHTYQNGGTHYVSLFISDSLNGFCGDTVIQAVNITGVSCTANAGFTLSPTSTPHYWTATPVYPWNVIAASWSWGDGSHTDSLYTSHTYSASGQYIICLTVTASCGSTATACGSYSLNKSSGTLVHVNVQPPSVVGIEEPDLAGNSRLLLYPVPASHNLHVRLENETQPVQCLIFDGTGKNVYSSAFQNNLHESTIDISSLANGIYIFQVTGSDRPHSVKFIVNR